MSRPICWALVATILLFSQSPRGQTWGGRLKESFDIVDTFEDYPPWTGMTSTAQNPGVTDPQDLPLDFSGVPSRIWLRYFYNPQGEKSGEGRRGPWIGYHGPGLQVGTKGLKFSTRGFGPLEMQTYLGNGSSTSGYTQVYLFFRAFFPKSAFPTNTNPLSCADRGDVEFNQSVYDANGYLYLTGWKFVNFGTGFTSVSTHPSGCYYGDGEAWVNLSNLNNDRGQHAIFLGTTCFTGGRASCVGPTCTGYPGMPSIGFDELGAVEIRLKLETYAGGALTKNGEVEAWWYDSTGNATRLIFTDQVTAMQPEDAGHLINRIIINGNKHRYDPTGPPTTPAGSNCNVGEYRLGTGMAPAWYLDDFIVDDQRIGPRYFALLSGSGQIPQPPRNVKIR